MIDPAHELTDQELRQAQKIADAAVPEIGADEIASREQMRGMPIRKCRETYKIPLDLIKVRPGYNVRLNLGDIEELAAGIVASGMRTEPIEVDLLTEGIAYIIDGHRRHEAFELLRSKGHSITEIECFIAERGTSEEDRIVAMFVSQNNKKLEPLEVAACLMRLQKRGWTLDQIAERTGKSRSYVKNHLRYERQPRVVKELMAKGNLDQEGVNDLIVTFPKEADRVAYVERELLPIAEEGVKIELARKGSASFIAERVKRLEQMEGIFSSATRTKIIKMIKYLRGDIDEVDLVNL